MLKPFGREWSQIRRCHRCGETHEAHGIRVLGCRFCGARFAPFFFSELTPDALLETAQTPLAKPKSLAFSSAKKYRPLIGFTWWWEDSVRSGRGELLMPRA